MIYEITTKEEDGSESTFVISEEEELEDFLQDLKVGMIDEWLTNIEITVKK